jgi:hypothetical protein
LDAQSATYSPKKKRGRPVSPAEMRSKAPILIG